MTIRWTYHKGYHPYEDEWALFDSTIDYLWILGRVRPNSDCSRYFAEVYINNATKHKMDGRKSELFGTLKAAQDWVDELVNFYRAMTL